MSSLPRQLATAERLIPLSFLLLILAGTLLLLLPWSTTAGIGLVDALFTSTSAVCVTGLSVLDTGTGFTLFGQWVILLLVQAGGLGIMTLSVAFLYMVAGKVSLLNRDLIQESISLGPVQGLLPQLLLVLRITLLIEGIGAILLAVRFMQDMPPARALYSGIFHSVAAFCNAGFSIHRDSLMGWQDDWWIGGVIMGLITMGGLGFMVLAELWRWWRTGRNRTLSLSARVVLRTSLILVVAGTVAILILEWHNGLAVDGWRDMPGAVLQALFQSVTCRTAGFNTIPMDNLTEPTYLIMIVLMAIGASPASTGGGIKTTTVTVLLAHIRSRFRDIPDTVIQQRRIPDPIVARALTITIFSVGVMMTGTLLLLLVEGKGVPLQAGSELFLKLGFEAVSAFGTVGLSTGITPELGPAGKLVVVALMFIGRVGPLGLALAIGRRRKPAWRLATDNVMVG